MATVSVQSSRKFYLVTGLLYLVLAGMWGCTDTSLRGTIASVNGKSITLAQVKALRNSTYFDWSAPSVTDVDVTWQQYGAALTNLIVMELVKQQLEKKKIAVRDEEVLAEEKLIRADYPPETFEKMLVSEAIDLDMWRFLLHNYLSVQRFFEKLLRNEVIVNPEEASDYAKANPHEFTRPSWVHLFLISGGDEKLVVSCARELDRTGDPIHAQENNPDVVIRTVRMDLPRLDPVFARAVAALRPGDVSPVIRHNNEFHQILLLESLPKREADANEIYLQAEAVLMERKIHAAYNAWVRERIRKSSIRVSRPLLQYLSPPGEGIAAGEHAPARP